MRLILSGLLVAVGASIGGDQTPDGLPAQIIFPLEQRLHNTGGRDGAGLCVFTSIEHSARWQNVPQLVGFQKWMTSRPGGGHPQKVDQMIEAICKERGLPKPSYIQVQNGDLEVLKQACESGRMPAITYCVSATGRYGGKRVAHMISLIHCDGKWFGCLDNNMEKEIEWLNEAEFKKTYTGMGGGWCVILLSAGSPPDPKN